MNFSIRLADIDIFVEVRYKDNKNIYMKLVSQNQLLITCSPLIPKSYILEFIESKKNWILKAIEQRKAILLFSKMRIINQRVYYLGIAYPIIFKMATRKKISKRDDVYYVEASVYDEEIILRLFYEYHKNDLLFVMNELKVKYENIIANYRIKSPSLKVKYLRGRHGQCVTNKGEITLSSRMIHFDKSLIEYVLWHEYCHLIVPNHSKRFYDVLSYHMSDYQKYRNMLK